MASMKMEDVQHVPLRNHPITQRWPVCSLRGIKSYLGQQREALPELDVRAGGGGGGGEEESESVGRGWIDPSLLRSDQFSGAVVPS